MDPVTSLASIKRELEDGWKLFDTAWAGFGPAEWARKFGKTWTYAEQPYHLAYFDAMIAEYAGYGAHVPAERLHRIKSMGEMNDWNRSEFAKRRPGHTVQDSLHAMYASRDTVRRLLAKMTDADLDGPAYMPLIFGWTNVRSVVQALIVHNVAEYWKLWIRLGKKGAAPSPAAVHLRLDFMMKFMPASLNRELAKKSAMTLVWRFEGPGGGAWTFHVANGSCTVTEADASNPDLVLTMKPETFHKIVAKMSPPPLLMLTGQMKVKGLSKMGLFGKLFPEPRPDQIIEPAIAAAV